MNGIHRHVLRIAMLISLTIAAGCQSVPSKDSGMGKIGTVAVTGDRVPWRSVVIAIHDERGTEVYSVFKKSLFQVSVDLPAGVYEITHTCGASQPIYEERPAQWRHPKYTTRLRLNAGDSIKFVAEAGIAIVGLVCQGKFFVPAGQLLQANRVVP